MNGNESSARVFTNFIVWDESTYTFVHCQAEFLVIDDVSTSTERLVDDLKVDLLHDRAFLARRAGFCRCLGPI